MPNTTGISIDLSIVLRNSQIHLLPSDDPHTVWLHLEELLEREYPSCILHLIDKDKNLVSIT